MSNITITNNETHLETIFNEWKELKIDHAVFTFNCGGDQMNDSEWAFYGADDKKIEATANIERHLEDEVYRRVEFYVNSGDSYMGEYGEVKVTLNEDDEEPCFNYEKDATAEYSETFTDTPTFELTEEQIKLIKDKVSNINGGEGDYIVNYKDDCILSDEEDEMLTSLCDEMKDFVVDHEIENAEGEWSEWYNWTTNPDGEDIAFEDDGIVLHIQKSYNYEQPSEW